VKVRYRLAWLNATMGRADWRTVLRTAFCGGPGEQRAALRYVAQAWNAIFRLAMRMRLWASACHSSTAWVLASPRTLN
jgi:hypothetical protein